MNICIEKLSGLGQISNNSKTQRAQGPMTVALTGVALNRFFQLVSAGKTRLDASIAIANGLFDKGKYMSRKIRSAANHYDMT